MVKGSKKLSGKQRDLLVRIVLEKYEKDPHALRRAVPELTSVLEEAGVEKGRTSREFFEITEQEALDRQAAYQKVAINVERGEKLVSRESAIEALEHVTALREGPLRASHELRPATILKLVRIATGLSLEKKGALRRCVIREGELSRIVSLVRGVRGHLSWDRRLLIVEVDPKGLALRIRALAFAGMGRDPQQDTARNHDRYAYGDSDG